MIHRYQPVLLRCDGETPDETDWKISPYGREEPDRECYWVSSFEEALEELKYWREWHIANPEPLEQP